MRLQTAIRLEPSNSEYRAVLARNQALSVATVDDAIANLRSAVQLNPYQSSYWLDLAGSYQISGRIEEQAEAVQQAAVADPMTPHVAAEAANFFLIEGDVAKALPYFRTVLANDPDSLDSTLQLCWRASGDSQSDVRAGAAAKSKCVSGIFATASVETGYWCGQDCMGTADATSAIFSGETRAAILPVVDWREGSQAPQAQGGSNSRRSMNRFVAIRPLLQTWS